jgi:hypothetical protein
MVIVILLIGMLMSMAIDRLLQLQIEAERVSVQHVIGVLDSALNLQIAEMVIKRGLESLRELENTNPMDYLAKQPYNYAGIKSGNAAAGMPDESWYFDAEKDVLVYKVKNRKYFESDIEGEPRIVLRLAVVYSDDVSGKNGSNIQGVRLENLNQYSWKVIDE